MFREARGGDSVSLLSGEPGEASQALQNSMESSSEMQLLHQAQDSRAHPLPRQNSTAGLQVTNGHTREAETGGLLRIQGQAELE